MVRFKFRYNTRSISTRQLCIAIIIFIYACSKTSSKLITLIEFDLATWNILIIVNMLFTWLGVFLWNSTLILIRQTNISWTQVDKFAYNWVLISCRLLTQTLIHSILFPSDQVFNAWVICKDLVIIHFPKYDWKLFA